MKNKIVDFYLGANSQDGFASFFSELENPYNGYTSYVIKGGPGTGKSSLMKKVATEMCNEDLTELIHCSSDPDSLDAVLLHTSKLTFCDGTPPHVIEPKYPGAFERVINLLDAFDNDSLAKHKLEIVRYSLMISSYHKKFCNLLKCVNILRGENKNVLKPSVDYKKLERNVNSIFKKEIKIKPLKTGESKKRLLSAFTPKGILSYVDTINILCERVYSIEDRFSVISHEFMQLLSNKILSAGYDCYICYDPFCANSHISHVIVPELKLGFISQNKTVKLTPNCDVKTINYTRFINPNAIKDNKEFLSFNEKSYKSLVEEMLNSMSSAKALPDVLESYYIPNVDFSIVNEKYDKLLKKINK